MDSGDFLSIHPQELQFPFELNKQIGCTMQLTNHTDNFIAFKVKTTNPKKYSVRPNTGIVLPNSKHDLLVTMQAQKEAPADMQCKDKFLLQSVITNAETTIKDITSDMFNKESGNVVEEMKLKVTYLPPPPPPVEQEESDDGSVSDNGNLYNDSAVPRHGVDSEDDSSQENAAVVSRFMEEKNSALLANKKIHQEMELLRREISQKRAAIPYIYVFLVGFIGVFIGYVIKKI